MVRAEMDGLPDLVPITKEELKQIVTSIPAQLRTLQAFIPSKGDPDRFRTYTTYYSIDKSARSFLRTEKLGVSAAVSGVSKSTNKANMDKVANEYMEELSQAVVHRIQQFNSSRIVQLLRKSCCTTAECGQQAPAPGLENQYDSHRERFQLLRKSGCLRAHIY